MGWFDKIFVKNNDESYIPIDKGDKPYIVITSKEAEEMLKTAEDKVESIKPLDLTKVKFVKAANQSNRKDKVRGICLHHIMMGSFKKNEEFLTSKASGVSAHYVLGRNGELTQMVNTQKKAWHAGTSSFKIGGEERDNLNNCLIGIEIVNPGYVTQNSKSGRFWYNCGGEIVEWKGDEPKITTIAYPGGKMLSGYYIPYPEKQITKLVALCKALVQKYPEITRDDIVAHYQISEPIGRKNDPFGLDLDYVKDLIYGKEE